MYFIIGNDYYLKKDYEYKFLDIIFEKMSIGEKLIYRNKSYKYHNFRNSNDIQIAIRWDEIENYIETIHERRKRIIKNILK